VQWFAFLQGSHINLHPQPEPKIIENFYCTPPFLSLPFPLLRLPPSFPPLYNGSPRSFNGPPFPPFSFLSLPPLRSKPHEIKLGGLESAVSSPSGAWGGPAAEIKFDAFLP